MACVADDIAEVHALADLKQSIEDRQRTIHEEIIVELQMLLYLQHVPISAVDQDDTNDAVVRATLALGPQGTAAGAAATQVPLEDVERPATDPMLYMRVLVEV